MKAPEHFEVMENYSCYRMAGNGPLAEALGKAIEAITFARENGIRHLLIDTTKWLGVANPDTLERYDVGSAFSKAAAWEVKVATVVRPEMIDPERFGILVATNRGLIGNVFDSEKDALAWLLDPNAR